MTAFKKSIFFFLFLQCSSLWANSANPVEVQVVAFEGGRLMAYAEVIGDLDKNVISTTHFALQRDGSKEWIDLGIRKTPGFDVSVNPTLAVGHDGTLFRVSMAAKNDLSAGLLEMSYSKDKGETWSEWQTIVSSQGSTPDKPWVTTTAKGEVFVVYTELIPFSSLFDDTNPDSKKKKKRFYTSLRMVKSNDLGKTWEKPLNVADVWELEDPTNVAGAQGGFLATDISRETLYLSYSQYVKREGAKTAAVYFAKRGSDKIWSAPVKLQFSIADEKGFNPPLTFLAVSPNGKNLMLIVYAAHYYYCRPTAFISTDAGTTWSSPIEFDEIMTPVSALVDDRGRYSLLYSQITEQEKGLQYKVFSTKSTIEKLLLANQATSQSCESKLLLGDHFIPKTANQGQIYWGGYHSLLQNPDGSQEAYFIAPTLEQDGKTRVETHIISEEPSGSLRLF